MKKPTFWSDRLNKEFKQIKTLSIAALLIAVFLKLLAILNTRLFQSKDLNSDTLNFFSLLAFCILAFCIIGCFLINNELNKSPEDKRIKLIRKTIKYFNWVEGTDVCWEFDCTMDRLMVIKIKNLTPICVEGKKAYKSIESGTLFLCVHCGNKIPLSKKGEVELQITNGLQRRVKILNEPIDKPTDIPPSYHIEGTIRLK